ncbi:O-succinylhomoserine sulfhydrylase [Alphaproteobacteria bacterium SO-S41]|nr:O-succinylhomoserine sulfhydrylase [Alphaproteobacteria bacterium SO-S41]
MSDDIKSKADPKSWRARTRAVRGGTLRSQHGETSEAMFLTSGFVYPNAGSAERRFKNEEPGYIYSRFNNPTVAAFEERLLLLEDAPDDVECRGTATGLAAVHASIFGHLSAGDHVVSARALFGGCRYIIEELAPRLGIQSTLIDGRDLNAWEAAIRPNTKAFFLETPSNPTLEICDLRAIARLAHSVGALLIVDNVFASPIFQKPFELGADIVVYSATKHMDGQGRVLGGAILAKKDLFADKLGVFLRNTGPSLSPFNAWVLLKGLETMDLRVRQQAANAVDLIGFLKSQKGIANARYPFDETHPQVALAKGQMSGGGTIVTFEVEGGREAAFNFANALELIDISNNLGDAKSLLTHPDTTTHARLPEEERRTLGITEGMFRLSVGLEDPEDIKDDIARALKSGR